jgi:hypothetical protein
MKDSKCIQTLTNQYLASLDMAESDSTLLAEIKEWLKMNECTKEVVLEEVIMTSLPPKRAYYITIEMARLILVISLKHDRWEFDSLAYL